MDWLPVLTWLYGLVILTPSFNVEVITRFYCLII